MFVRALISDALFNELGLFDQTTDSIAHTMLRPVILDAAVKYNVDLVIQNLAAVFQLFHGLYVSGFSCQYVLRCGFDRSVLLVRISVRVCESVCVQSVTWSGNIVYRGM